MKRKEIIVIGVVVVLVTLLLASVLPALAAKPVKDDGGGNLIPIGNGFPSGPHYNLNIHGKKTADQCPPLYSDNNSVFIPEYVNKGDLTINYVQNIQKKGKNSSENYIDNLIVLDNCGFDGDVLIQLPYEDEGYLVYSRILAKPNNNPNKEPSEIIIWPNQVFSACDNVTASSENATSCDEVVAPIGLVVGPNIYTVTDNYTFKRFEQGTAKVKGRGKSTAVEITPFFMFTGYVADASLDIAKPDNGSCTGNLTSPDPDGSLTDCDIPENADDIVNYFSDTLGVLTDNVTVYGDQGGALDTIDTIAEWLTFHYDLYIAWNALVTPPAVYEYSDYYPVRVDYHDDEFILNIADLVLAGQEVENKGTKLLQIRFYPVASTFFGPVKN